MKDPQKIINEWCDLYEVPQIQVIRVKVLKNCEAYFDSNRYEIYVKKNVTISTLRHEFTHYVFRLVNVVQVAEEKICELMEESKL